MRARAQWPLRRAAAALTAAVALALTGTIGTAGARADAAPQAWLPTGVDLVRTLRPCTEAVGGPPAPICWSVTEDLAAWMALPPGSPYPWGQCTYYVGLMRPDIWNHRAPPSSDSPADWNAWTWAGHAQAEGLSVDGSPRPGDVMVYSRAAVENSTGHVAIVDGVGTSRAAPHSIILTVSEMNVVGLDDPAQGQGDTMVLLVPRSQLVPGMIQFIHQPPPGYVPPPWPSGSGAAEAADTPASVPVDPSLAVGLFSGRIETVSESTAPERAVITSATSGRTVAKLRLEPNRVASLRLPHGRYRVCVTQPASGQWAAASECAIGNGVDLTHAQRLTHRARHRSA